MIAQKPRIKFLTVIWGERYIAEFCRAALPSLLAPGNLPALAEAFDLEVLVLTSEESTEVFFREPAFRALETHCPVRFIYIDDLIASGVYGITLTLAYARGIRDSGDRQTETCFVFMNSDFVLADGSLATLASRINEGHHCVMTPSLRACSEAVLPALSGAVDPATGRLIVAPRKMVRLALDNLHPTVIGKTITQDFVQCTTHNQLYWQVDENTLLGRYHLIFMLAIRPERPMPPVNSYCDYGFVPELVPSGEFEILGDSDEFFMLELQSAAQERQFLHCGKPDIREVARELSVWTTREHRRFAEVDAVFHARELPSNLGEVRKGAADFVSRLHRKMKRRPVDHVRHFYWVSGVEAWLTLRRTEQESAEEVPLPPECGPLYPKRRLLTLAAPRDVYLKLLGVMRRLAGAKPYVPFWSHAWLDSRLVLDWIASVRQTSRSGRNLLVCTSFSPLSRSLAQQEDFDVVHLQDLLDGKRLAEWQKSHGSNARYENILCHVFRTDVRQTRNVLERLNAFASHAPVVAIYIDHDTREADPGNFSWELAQYVQDILPAGWTGLRFRTRFAGGRIKRRLRLLESRLIGCLWPANWRRVVAFPFAVLLLPIVVALTGLNNWRLRRGHVSCPPYCSSALLTLSQLHTPKRKMTSRQRSAT